MFHESKPFSVKVATSFVAQRSEKPFISISIIDESPESLFDIVDVSKRQTYFFRKFQGFDAFTSLKFIYVFVFTIERENS
jgi:hypothetical protein